MASGRRPTTGIRVRVCRRSESVSGGEPGLRRSSTSSLRSISVEPGPAGVTATFPPSLIEKKSLPTRLVVQSTNPFGPALILSASPFLLPRPQGRPPCGRGPAAPRTLVGQPWVPLEGEAGALAEKKVAGERSRVPPARADTRTGSRSEGSHEAGAGSAVPPSPSEGLTSNLHFQIR